MARRKPQGHYCKICGERKSNESFSGKGHAAHICKACSRLSPQQQAEQMTLNKLSGLPMGYLSNAEVKWLKNRTSDPRPEVRGLARAVYAERFPYAARNQRKQQLSIQTLELMVDSEDYDLYGDPMGTTVDEHSPEMAEIVRRICKNSNLHDPRQVQRFILDTRRRYEADSYLGGYHTEDELADQLISDMEEQIGLTDEPSTLLGLIRGHWVNAPVFPDARAFFDQCPVPIYIITNNGLPYMGQALRRNGLKAAGVVSADTVRAYKPHREIFDEALRVSGCIPGEVVHIGDSYDTDVVGARGAGISPVLLLRGRTRQHDDVETVDGLEQALELVFSKG